MLGFHLLSDIDRIEKKAYVFREHLVVVLLVVLVLAGWDQLTNNNEIKYSYTDNYRHHIS